MATVAYLCTDLLFSSKIRETARGLGLDVAPARDPAGLAAAAHGAALAIVDLRRPDAMIAIAALRDAGATSAVPTIGFCDHERGDLIQSARDAGCTRVYAKGKFSSSLAEILAGRVGETSPGL